MHCGCPELPGEIRPRLVERQASFSQACYRPNDGKFDVLFMKHFAGYCVFTKWRRTMMLLALADRTMSNVNKKPPLIEDLRAHSQEQIAELRFLLETGLTGRPDPRRPGFFELDGVANVYYVFRYPTGHKVLLLAAWQREVDPVAEMVAYSCPAA
jgi:hypothetical protein